jgi:hypothetical protein
MARQRTPGARGKGFRKTELLKTRILLEAEFVMMGPSKVLLDNKSRRSSVQSLKSTDFC